MYPGFLISAALGLAFAYGGNNLVAPRLDFRGTCFPTAGQCECGTVIPRYHRLRFSGWVELRYMSLELSFGVFFS